MRTMASKVKGTQGKTEEYGDSRLIIIVVKMIHENEKTPLGVVVVVLGLVVVGKEPLDE